jgi:hypothetical protein
VADKDDEDEEKNRTRPGSKQAIKDLLSKIPIETVPVVALPPGYEVRAPESSSPESSSSSPDPTTTTTATTVGGALASIQQDDVSKFLPPGFKLKETEKSAPATTGSSLLDDILGSVDIDESLLPKGFKQPFRPKTPAATTTTAATTTEEQSKVNIKITISKITLPTGKYQLGNNPYSSYGNG